MLRCPGTVVVDPHLVVLVAFSSFFMAVEERFGGFFLLFTPRAQLEVGVTVLHSRDAGCMDSWRRSPSLIPFSSKES